MPRRPASERFVVVRVSSIKLDAGRKSDLEDNTDHQRDVISRRRPDGRTDGRRGKIPAIIGLRRVRRAWKAAEKLEFCDFQPEFTRTHRADMSSMFLLSLLALRTSKATFRLRLRDRVLEQDVVRPWLHVK